MKAKLDIFHQEETYRLGTEFGEKAYPGMVIALQGDLGAGKTVFAKGFAKGIGIQEEISSPTFTLVNEYEGEKFPFYHFDVYRIEDPDEMRMIGFEEYLSKNAVVLIEWANRIPELLPKDTIWLTVERNYEKGEEYREVTVQTESHETVEYLIKK